MSTVCLCLILLRVFIPTLTGDAKNSAWFSDMFMQIIFITIFAKAKSSTNSVTGIYKVKYRQKLQKKEQEENSNNINNKRKRRSF